MAPMPPYRNWMGAPLGSDEYMDGIELCLKFINESLGNGTICSCLCSKCRNSGGTVYLNTAAEHLVINGIEHLVINGIDQSYTTWYFHGEAMEENEDACVDTVDLANEVLRHGRLEVDECMKEVSSDEDFEAPSQQDEQTPN